MVKMTDGLCDIIGELEFIVGNQCYNPNSYNGWTGEYGSSFRYPVWVGNEYGNEEKTFLSLEIWSLMKSEELNEKIIRNLKYKFGSNHLYIGEALIDVLNYLEKRYGLDFAKLEASYQLKKIANEHQQ